MRKKEVKRILSIGSLNCHGMKEKVDYPEFHHLVSENDIFGVSETWLKDKDKISLPNFDYYPLNRKINQGPTKGGICGLVHLLRCWRLWRYSFLKRLQNSFDKC